MKYIIVIPARYKSERLPGKPLLNIGGLPMIVRTYNQCTKVVNKDKIVAIIAPFAWYCIIKK